MEKSLPAIPPKRYFTIGEVSELCGVKPYVLRYWEQEFSQLRPMKRRGNRRYYQHHEVLLIRRIRDLLYEQGFTISGARNRLAEVAAHHDPVVGEVELERAAVAERAQEQRQDGNGMVEAKAATLSMHPLTATQANAAEATDAGALDGPSALAAKSTPATAIGRVRQELLSIRQLLSE